MGIIKLLDDLTTNQIAAGEVVERPSSVVKELCENSLDANSTNVYTEIKNGGITSISVTDNGCGMDSEDIKKAFLRHSTSKINNVSDFETLTSMGFRGEALASIAAVSRINIKSRRPGEENGYFLKLEAGKIADEGCIGCSTGTKIEVENLFFNTPARYKFLKKDYTEASYISDIIERFVMARPDVSFYLTNNSKEVIHSPGNNDLKSAVFSVYGKKITDELLEVSYKNENIKIYGFAGTPTIARNNRNHQSVFVNNRYVKSPVVVKAVEDAYKTLLMKGKFPFCVIKIEISPSLVDVNVHPRKIQVKFGDESSIYRNVYHALKNAVDKHVNKKSVEYSDYDKIPENEQASKKIEQRPADEYDRTQYREEKALEKEYIEPEQTRFKTDDSNAKGNDYEERDNSNTITEEISTDPEIISEDMKYLGSLFNTYLLFEKDEKLIIIDQHAAHERILFEKLLKISSNDKIVSQSLISPEIAELTTNEMLLFKDKRDIFEKLGFECEEFADKSVIIRAIPLGDDSINPDRAFKAALDSLADKNSDDSEIIRETLYSIACKAAVKAHDKLQPPEIKSLLEEMAKTSRSSYCPHGRPCTKIIEKKEIEKWFKRIIS